MDAVEFLNIELKYLRVQEDAVMDGLTEEQFNWNPPGSANSIRATFVHLVATEDYYINKVLAGGERLWDQQGWGEKIGLSAPPSATHSWDEIHQATLSLVTVLDYARAVREATEAYLLRFTPEELERPVVLYGRDRIVADVLTRVIVHSALHTGDIAAVRGLQGAKGLRV